MILSVIPLEGGRDDRYGARWFRDFSRGDTVIGLASLMLLMEGDCVDHHETQLWREVVSAFLFFVDDHMITISLPPKKTENIEDLA